MKKKIANGDLLEIVRQQLLIFDDCPPALPIAIVPHDTQGWAIMTKRIRQHPLCARRIESIEKQLRAVYTLSAAD